MMFLNGSKINSKSDAVLGFGSRSRQVLLHAVNISDSIVDSQSSSKNSSCGKSFAAAHPSYLLSAYHPSGMGGASW